MAKRFAHTFILGTDSKPARVFVRVSSRNGLAAIPGSRCAAGAALHALFCAIATITWALVVIVQRPDDSLVLQLCIFLKSHGGWWPGNGLSV